MAQVLKDRIKQAIYAAAVDEFYNNGYKASTIRNIVQKAHIPSGLLYSYYKNKQDLFNSIVKPVYSEIRESLKNIEESEKHPFEKFNEIESKIILKMFNKRKQFIILIDKSRGTKYEHAKDLIIGLVEYHIKYQLNKKMKDVYLLDDVFLHILANNFMEGIFEIIRHYKSRKWAEKMLKLVSLQYYYGITALLK